jgi:hypothetical protein
MLIIFNYLEVREAKLIYILRLFNRKICNMYLEDYPTIAIERFWINGYFQNEERITMNNTFTDNESNMLITNLRNIQLLNFFITINRLIFLYRWEQLRTINFGGQCHSLTQYCKVF